MPKRSTIVNTRHMRLSPTLLTRNKFQLPSGREPVFDFCGLVRSSAKVHWALSTGFEVEEREFELNTD